MTRSQLIAELGRDCLQNSLASQQRGETEQVEAWTQLMFKFEKLLDMELEENERVCY